MIAKIDLRLMEIELGYKKKESINEAAFKYYERRIMNQIKKLQQKASKDMKLIRANVKLFAKEGVASKIHVKPQPPRAQRERFEGLGPS